jgi:hypothetical protein
MAAVNALVSCSMFWADPEIPPPALAISSMTFCSFADTWKPTVETVIGSFFRSGGMGLFMSMRTNPGDAGVWA